jgi:hypothetical protein
MRKKKNLHVIRRCNTTHTHTQTLGVTYKSGRNQLPLRHFDVIYYTYEDLSKSFRTSRLERELQMVQLSATTCGCIAILWVSLVRFAAITLCVASQRVFIVASVYFVSESVRKLFDTPSYVTVQPYQNAHHPPLTGLMHLSSRKVTLI